MHRIIIKRNFSDITDSCIEFCRYAEETLTNLCKEDENIDYLVNIFFSEPEAYTKEWWMRRTMRYATVDSNENINYFRKHEWPSRFYYYINNPIVSVINFLTENIDCSLNRKYYEETGYIWAVKFDYEKFDIDNRYFGSLEEMKKSGYTNSAKDYANWLEKYAEKMVKKNS